MCTLKTMDLFSGIPNLSFTILPMFNLRGKVDYNQSFIYLEYRPVRQKGHHDGRKFHPISYNVRHRSAPVIIYAHHSFRIGAVWQPHGQLVPLTAQVHHCAVHLGQVGHLTDQPQNNMLNLMCIPASMFSNEKEKDLQPVRVQLLISLLPVKPEKLFETGELGVQHDQVFTYPSPPSTFHRRHSVGPPSLERSLPERVRL